MNWAQTQIIVGDLNLIELIKHPINYPVNWFRSQEVNQREAVGGINAKIIDRWKGRGGCGQGGMGGGGLKGLGEKHAVYVQCNVSMQCV